MALSAERTNKYINLNLSSGVASFDQDIRFTEAKLQRAISPENEKLDSEPTSFEDVCSIGSYDIIISWHRLEAGMCPAPMSCSLALSGKK